LAQDDYYYEIQLTNKQLVFYFMAGATGLILSFLAGVMVGRGVDSAVAEAQPPKTPVREERIVTEETPKPTPAPASAEELNYAKRLESDKPDESLERTAASKAASDKQAGSDKGKSAKSEAASKDRGSKEPASAPGRDVPTLAKAAGKDASAKDAPSKDAS